MQDEIEDEDFDLASVLAEFERQAKDALPAAGVPDDDWEEVKLA